MLAKVKQGCAIHELHEYESQLMRRLAGLLYVDDIDSGRAAKRARARLSQDG